MILAGIDEAGYGPVLGPLVVGCVAFEISDASGEEVPCLWKRLGRSVSRKRSKTGRKLHVNDSKLVYSPASGLKELERSVLALVAAMGTMPAELGALLAVVAPEVCAEMERYPWYRSTADDRFPIEQDATPIALLANALRQEMQRTSAGCVLASARVVCEHELNRMMDATRNKSSTLFSITSMHLDQLLRRFAHKDLTIVCDRHGGRGHYGPLLRLMFEDWSLEIVAEVEACSEYRLSRDGNSVRLFFREKAEAACLPVAYASMISKYLREALMRRFNAYWSAMLPGLTPTAGYHPDGIRFLGDIAALRSQLGIADEQLIRCR